MVIPYPRVWPLIKRVHPPLPPTAVLEGAQLPFGGHKGSAIAMMVELLAAGLTGSHLSFETDARRIVQFSSVHLPKKNLNHISIILNGRNK
mmetsp:Transcript_6253/g.7188  ORF Transcript_6253/g.7188 Transcript_6253/m.7188 type:complete len:91 (+) Transcript_6253:78-350(+)